MAHDAVTRCSSRAGNLSRGLLAGLHQDGLVCSVDDGETWSPPDAGVNARLLSAAGFGRDGTVYVAYSDAGLRVSPEAVDQLSQAVDSVTRGATE